MKPAITRLLLDQEFVSFDVEILVDGFLFSGNGATPAAAYAHLEASLRDARRKGDAAQRALLHCDLRPEAAPKPEEVTL